MKTGAVALISLVLILSVDFLGFADEAAKHFPNAAESGGPAPAVEYSYENSAENESGHLSVHWYKKNGISKLTGLALVIHGLNCRPDKMESIIKPLTEAGINCLNLSLRGHGDNYPHRKNETGAEARLEAFKSVTYRIWKTEADQAYRRIESKANQDGVPLFFVGFSMGGLLGVDLLVSNPGVQFDKMVLFAPALKMHKRNSLLKVLSPFPRLVIPSMGHESYLTNGGTSMAAYNALFEMHAHVEERLGPIINIPTIVFIDKKDELISFSGLQNMVRDQNLDQWEIFPVKKDKAGAQVKMHHLIIDRESVGNNMWQKIVEATITHLLDGF